MKLSLKFTLPPCSVTVSIRTGTPGACDALSEGAAFAFSATVAGFNAVLSCPVPSFATIPWTFSVPSGCTMIRE